MTRRVYTRTVTTTAEPSTTTYAGWEPRECCVCGERIAKSRQGGRWGQLRQPDGSYRTYARHLTCRSKPCV